MSVSSGGSGLTHMQAALVLSLGAGLSTGIGAAMVFCTKSLNPVLLACTLAFSAGVMLYVSLVEVVGLSKEYFEKEQAEAPATAYATLSFFLGVVVMWGVDAGVHRVMELVFKVAAPSANSSATCDIELASGSRSRNAPPEFLGSDLGSAAPLPASPASVDSAQHCHEHSHDDEAEAIAAVANIQESHRLFIMGAVVSAAIALHNFPEGMATYVAAYHSITAGLPLAIAIAVHNIPEGLAVAMPIYHATNSRRKAVLWGTLSGLSEPVGALFASLIANEGSSGSSFGVMFGLTAGMMVFVCISELLPAAFSEARAPRGAITGSFFVGSAVMALSLIIEKFASPAPLQ